MRKVIAAINLTLDGFCDHNAMNPGEDIHQHYADLLNNAGLILYGRITYELMQYWPPIIKNPTGNKAIDNFAKTIDRIPKIVFSNTLKEVEWPTAKLAKKDLTKEVLELIQIAGKDILVGSRSLIIQLANDNLIDEYQLCIHPVILGRGLPLFYNISKRIDLKLLQTKTFSSGEVILYYKPKTNEH